MKYENTYHSFLEYVEKCKNKIKTTFWGVNDTDTLIIKKHNNIDEIVRQHRLKMIDIKVDHTMRMIEQIILANKKLGFEVNMKVAIKVATLYHDVGRLSQATWSNTFSDARAYKNTNNGFSNHAEEGYNIFLNNDFNIDDKYIPAIGQTILHHQDSHLYDKLYKNSTDDFTKINIDKVLTGKFELNEAEWKIVAIIVQLVADVDKADILYQHLLDDFEMIRDYIVDTSGNEITEIARYWGVKEKEILEFNGLTKNDAKPMRLLIPVKNMPNDKLIVPSYMKSMFYKNSWPELKILIHDRNWTFITIIWWRLSYFLNQIKFTSTLMNIEETHLLDQIYNKIPDRFKSLVYEAFVYAKEQLLQQTLLENKDNIYVYRKAK